jgi:flagellin
VTPLKKSILGTDAEKQQRPERATQGRSYMVINTNLSAQNGARLLNESSSALSKSLARLSSGSKIISPEDDAAGLAVAMRFEAQISRTKAANSNVANAISFNQTQDGFLKKVAKALDRMGELAILAQDVTKTDNDRALYNAEFTSLGAYINDIATKEFNGVALFDGEALDVTTDGEGSTFNMTGVDLADQLYLDATGSTIATAEDAVTALSNVKAAITKLSEDRANLGANISRLHSTSEQLNVLSENLSASVSRLQDVDIAEESTKFAKFNILVQAGTAMLAQANQSPQAVLKLIQ